MLLSWHQNAGQNHDKKSADKYMGMTVTNKNWILEEINMTSNLHKAWYHLASNFSSNLLSKMAKIMKLKKKKRKIKSKAIPITGHGGIQSSETLMDPTLYRQLAHR
jgi:hypothetical protein